MFYIRIIPSGTYITIKVPFELILYSIFFFWNFSYGGTSGTVGMLTSLRKLFIHGK